MARRKQITAVLLLLLCASWVGTVGCASGQKKRRRTVLLTEYDDARVGKEASVDVRKQMGVLDDPKLNAYVTEIGLKLLRGLPRRSFQYNFFVVDQEEPNAFALPGGWIFVSRGLLALANNEDELACVIGHEITHAHHRHAAAQQQLGKRMNPVAMPWNRMAKMAAYGRDMERDADKGGQVLCGAAGYDPMGMSTFLAGLGNYERLRVGYSRGPSFFDSHPGATERAAVNAIRAGEMRWTRDPLLGDTTSNYLHKVEGLAIGARPEAGVFVGDRFIHPDLNFYVRFPPGWVLQNTNEAVGALAPRGAAVIFLQADAPEGEPKVVAQKWLEKTRSEQKLQVQESKPVKIGHIDSWRLRLRASTRAGSLTSYVTFIPYQNATWRITGVTRSGDAKKFLGRALATTRTFRPLTNEERQSLSEAKLALIVARRGEALAALSERSGNTYEIPELAAMNGLFIDHRFRGGEIAKIVLRTPYTPRVP
jgi:predicted Zn-dependent protease